MTDWGRFAPGFWLQNEASDAIWDGVLNDALDRYGIGEILHLTVMVGPFEVWTGNWPYQYGYQRGPNEFRGLPYTRTRRRLARMIDEKREADLRRLMA